jgi:hypothetical protein
MLLHHFTLSTETDPVLKKLFSFWNTRQWAQFRSHAFLSVMYFQNPLELKCNFSCRKNRIGYTGAGIPATLAPRPFLIFCAALYISIQRPHTLSKVQYLVEGDVGKVIRFQELMTQVPKSEYCQCVESQRTCEAISNACLHISHPGLSTSPILNRCPFRWQCAW